MSETGRSSVASQKIGRAVQTHRMAIVAAAGFSAQPRSGTTVRPAFGRYLRFIDMQSRASLAVVGRAVLPAVRSLGEGWCPPIAPIANRAPLRCFDPASQSAAHGVTPYLLMLCNALCLRVSVVYNTRPIWKSAIRQVWKPALRGFACVRQNRWRISGLGVAGLSGLGKEAGIRHCSRTMTRLPRAFFGCIMLAAVCLAARGAGEPGSADGAGAYQTGHYRNLFAEAGHSPAEIQQKINAAFGQLFHGAPDTQAIYFPAGTNANGPLAYITDIKHHDVRTEGLSYGMMIAVELDKRAEFDALWNWSKTYLYVAETNHPSYGFFAWQARTNGVRMSQFVAHGWRRVLCHGPLFCGAPLGPGRGHLRLRGGSEPIIEAHAASGIDLRAGALAEHQPDRNGRAAV